jgi:hypothetical protein
MSPASAVPKSRAPVRERVRLQKTRALRIGRRNALVVKDEHTPSDGAAAESTRAQNGVTT